MKTKPQAILVAVAILSGLSVSTALVQGDSAKKLPLVPSGWLSAYPTIVQTGAKPTLSWGISYPSVVKDYITVSDDSITTKEILDCEVRVLGAGVTAGNSSGYTFVRTEAKISYANGDYSGIFDGTNLTVNPNTIVWSMPDIPKNMSLEFGGSYYYNNKWSTFYSSDSNTPNVRTLVAGDAPPSKIPQWNAPSLEQFLKPYLDPSGKVAIGPMDVIVFMELTHTKETDAGYDLQDMVLLVTFKPKVKTNNGHGNNIDGIDSSNPGNAPFINLDTDPTVDDEG